MGKWAQVTLEGLRPPQQTEEQNHRAGWQTLRIPVRARQRGPKAESTIVLFAQRLDGQTSVWQPRALS